MSKNNLMGREYWLDISNYHHAWANRARFAARKIPHLWVCDIGCGRQDLSQYLSPSAVYLPSDIKAWDDGVELCDLNEKILPKRYLAIADVAVLLGVVERIYDLPSLFCELSRSVEYLVVSYHPIERRPDNPCLTVWHHQYSTLEFTSVLADAGFGDIKTRLFQEQTIWYARSNLFSDEQRSVRAASRLTYAGARPNWRLRLKRAFGL
ncbi:hypothetical protein M2281_004950 [Mesorhizobium soli]|uniref:hypothetical protein n=1 Tax=Pseudaminobacter soli (ex Li et al. 2025) TaxID=1295366 RepID=UPI0024762040|nr:hypothetical protein [Mesorhizobium soli]MDH6234332.1 hypothetical protein [Mesorhizobium soli]